VGGAGKKMRGMDRRRCPWVSGHRDKAAIDSFPKRIESAPPALLKPGKTLTRYKNWADRRRVRDSKKYEGKKEVG